MSLRPAADKLRWSGISPPFRQWIRASAPSLRFVSFANSEWFLGGMGARRHDRPVRTFALVGSMTPYQAAGSRSS